MCVLSIKVPIRKKSGNLFNDPRIYIFFLEYASISAVNPSSQFSYLLILLNNAANKFQFIHIFIPIERSKFSCSSFLYSQLLCGIIYNFHCV